MNRSLRDLVVNRPNYVGFGAVRGDEPIDTDGRGQIADP